MMLESLKHEIHVWYTIPQCITKKMVIDNSMKILSEQEREQYGRFRFAKDRHIFLVSHALVRNVLSKYVELPSSEWFFSRSEYGRPEIANPNLSEIRFNLSHTNGLVACIVTSQNDCGIDVEKVDVDFNPIDISKMMYSKAEYKQLQQLTGQAQLDYFYSRWTLREAYIKARGIGISFPTHKLNFDIYSTNKVKIIFHSDIEDRSENWQLELLSISKEHSAAVAIRRQEKNKKIITYFVNDDLTSFVRH